MVSSSPPPATASGTVAVRLRDLHVAYGSRLALDGVSLDLVRGELVSVIGPNGSGKSTLLKAIVGLVPLDGGTVELDVADAGQRGRAIAYVPQHEAVRWEFPVLVQDVV